MATFTIKRSVTTGSGTTTDNTDYTGTAVTLVDESVTTGQTDFLINVAIDVSAVKAFYLVSDQAVTIETNSGSAADNTIVLVANVPYVWHTSWYDAFLLTIDVTKIYVTNASGSTATIEMRVLQDATP